MNAQGSAARNHKTMGNGMKRRLIAGAAVLLLVAACGGASLTDKAIEFDKKEPFGDCRSRMIDASGGKEWGMSSALEACKTVEEWANAAAFQPSAIGNSDGKPVTYGHLATACQGRDSLAVCADAIERKFIKTTGTDKIVKPKPLVMFAEACKVPNAVEDGGVSLTLDTGGEKGSGTNTIDEVACILAGLEAPTYVTRHIDSTRALDGQQSDEWGTYEARWTYHPDEGLLITFVDTEAKA